MSDVLWSSRELAAAAGGTFDGEPDVAIKGFSIDTRTITPGEVFVALTDARDGHDFVPAAFQAGAAAALVRTGYDRKAGDGALLRVDDPLRALERIGIAARARVAADARIVAVTGSAGKTGTKEMLRACLASFGATHAPDKSFNNHWGVPLTLARMPAATRYGIFEIGMNHAGEITPLVRMVRPQVAVITNVLPVHIGNFADGEAGVAAAKAEIFDGLEPGGTAVLPRDNPHYAFLAGRAASMGARIVSFGTSDAADIRALAIEPTALGSRVEVRTPSATVAFELGAPGRHLAMNALAVVAVAEVLGLDLETALRPLADVRAPKGRGARRILELPAGRLLLIDESYNANPASVAAAIAAAATVPREQFGRRVLVLGDMLELGPGSAELHLGLKEAIDAAGADLVFAAGPMMRQLFDALEPLRRGGWAPDAASLLPIVLDAVGAGDVVMVKGSLGSRMGPIVDALLARFAGVQTKA